jgi:hypothetical protein
MPLILAIIQSNRKSKSRLLNWQAQGLASGLALIALRGVQIAEALVEDGYL